MSDLISRKEAIEALRNAENHAFNGFYKGLVKAHKIIADLTSAEPERKKGKWIPENTRDKSWIFCCSECGRMAYYPQNHHNDGTKKCRYAFCPNCGADMREEK